MKFGLRTPSLKRRIAARTSWKRYVRHSMGLKAPRGAGFLTHPKKALYNRVYNRTSFSIDKLAAGHHTSHVTQQKTPIYAPGTPINGTGTIIRSSSRALTVTSKNFEELRTEMSEIYGKRQELRHELNNEKTKLFFLSTIHFASFITIFGFFYKGIAEARKAQQELVKEVESELSETYVKLTFADKSQLEKSWLNCIQTFTALMTSEKMWDMTYSEDIDRVRQRTIAVHAVTRVEFKPKQEKIDFIKSDLPHLLLPNMNGADLYFFPTFMLFYNNDDEFGIFDLRDINFTFKNQAYHEEQHVPSDAQRIGFTWKKANKDGSRDKRFKGNYQIPIMQYGAIEIKSESGLDEFYMFSNFNALVDFGKDYQHHFELLKKL